MLGVSSPAYADRVAWNVDIHQNKFPGPNDPSEWPGFANDFHIWGILESGDAAGNNPPTMATPPQVNFKTSGPNGNPTWQPQGQAFANFNSQIGNPVKRPLPPGAPPPQPPFYYFDANWSGGQVPFCQWVHFGLEFDETCHNIGYWLQAVWTYTDPQGVEHDPGGSPIYGFDVQDLAPEQYIQIQNASGVETTVKEMELLKLNKEEGAAFPLGLLNRICG